MLVAARERGRRHGIETEAVVEDLPTGFDALRAEARAQGFRQVERLAADWEARTTRFDREGEALLAARVNGSSPVSAV
jgi:hypothetical protein